MKLNKYIKIQTQSNLDSKYLQIIKQNKMQHCFNIWKTSILFLRFPLVYHIILNKTLTQKRSELAYKVCWIYIPKLSATVQPLPQHPQIHKT